MSASSMTMEDESAGMALSEGLTSLASAVGSPKDPRKQQPLIALLVAVGLALAGVGGYSINSEADIANEVERARLEERFRHFTEVQEEIKGDIKDIKKQLNTLARERP